MWVQECPQAAPDQARVARTQESHAIAVAQSVVAALHSSFSAAKPLLHALGMPARQPGSRLCMSRVQEGAFLTSTPPI